MKDHYFSEIPCGLYLFVVLQPCDLWSQVTDISGWWQGMWLQMPFFFRMFLVHLKSGYFLFHCPESRSQWPRRSSLWCLKISDNFDKRSWSPQPWLSVAASPVTVVMLLTPTPVCRVVCPLQALVDPNLMTCHLLYYRHIKWCRKTQQQTMKYYAVFSSIFKF